ncbi:MAG TPA: anaerobic ribonucleoside-triphosphate reductase activating protein [Candidatus Paceibacterota bacterium]|nr:anaerobic ribonucleoside-triphosphate reductase activating protein [Candidatus Paceibacterota bacterium]
MRIGGLQHSSLIDYPGHIGAIVFTVGCNFRCPYCHNPELVDETADELTEEHVLEFLEKRRGLLEAVTITGGEPTMHADLPDFLRKVKGLGFLVKLDSNGTNPDMLERVIGDGFVDYVAMDVKSPLSRYEATVGRPVNTEALRRSIALLIAGRIGYEFRTTVVKSLLSKEDVRGIGEAIEGARLHYLQKFVSQKTLNPAFLKKTTYSDEEFEEMQKVMEEYVDTCTIR